MREFMRTWVSQMEEQYVISIISYDWFYYEDKFRVQLYGPGGFGKLPGEPVITGEANGSIYYSLKYEDVEYIHLVSIEEAQNANN